MALADMPQPPVRLLLGSDALATATAAGRATAARDAEFADLSRSTDFEPAAVVRRFVDEVVNGGDLGVLDQLWAADLAWHGGSMGEIHGLAAFREHLAASTTGAFSGMHLDIHDVVTSGDTVVVRFTNSGTQTGPFMGTPPTGRHAEWLGIGVYRVAAGKIHEAWFGEDILGMLLQLGALTLDDHATSP